MRQMRRTRDSSSALRFRRSGFSFVAAVALGGLAVASSAFGAGNHTSFVVRSTLDGKKVLPHRIVWTAEPQVAHSHVLAVNFLIDGKQYWVANAMPYSYGGGGNYLITSFLKPGLHTFTVKVVTKTGQQASDSVKAKVRAGPPPPAKLAGTWKAFYPHTQGSPPAGDWRLTINSVGWRFKDTLGLGDSFDVTYPSPGLVRVGTGLETGRGDSYDGNGWCNDKPGEPARYRWTIHSTGLLFTWVSGSHQCGFANFLTQHTHPWKRVS